MVWSITVWAPAGTGWCSVCNTHLLPSVSCYSNVSDQDFRGAMNQRRFNFTGNWGNSWSIVHLAAQSYDSRKSSKERRNKTLKRRLSLSNGPLPNMNPEGGISHPLASNTVRASYTRRITECSQCVCVSDTYAGKNSNSTTHLGFPSSTVYCAVLFWSFPCILRKGKCLQLVLSWGPAAEKLTVLCSSPSRIWNVCSNTVYMILPIPNEGSITFGMISSTGTQKNPCHH